MGMGRSRRVVAGAVVVSAGLVLAATGPASAGWSVHDDKPTVTEVVPAAGGSEGQVCADQLKGRTGWIGQVAENQDPADFEIPSAALTSVTYEVRKAEPGPDPTLVRTFTTPVRTKVPVPIFAEIAERVYVFTTARFSVRLTGVQPGDDLWLVPATPPGGNPGAPANLTAVDCGDTGFIGEWEADLKWCRAPGGRLESGDLNGDGRTDLLCHYPATGAKAVALARTGGRFVGTDWQRNLGWCKGASRQLLVGDFNGDGRADLLCHTPATGYKAVALARKGGRFVGTDWRRNLGWCKGASRQLLVGDFNGDRRADLLCHTPATGYKAVALARTGGRFVGTDWKKSLGWCTGARQLLVGTFNGDRRADLLCHDPATGYKAVALARPGGRFAGTDWERDLGWCFHAGARLRVGDVTGDGRDDLLCHDSVTGYLWVARARTGGWFAGTDWERNMGWCRDPGTELRASDVNGDARDDLLCHDPATGYKWVAYSDL